MVVRTGSQGMAITSMVLGIVGVVFFFIGAGLLGLVALILGIVVLVSGRNGQGMAIAGVVMGAVSLMLTLIMVVIAVPKYTQMVKGARASDAKVQINAILHSAKIYQQETGGWPADITTLESGGYLELSPDVKPMWTFQLVGDQMIQAVSTSEMKGGAGNIVTFYISEGRWEGYGFPRTTGE